MRGPTQPVYPPPDRTDVDLDPLTGSFRLSPRFRRYALALILLSTGACLVLDEALLAPFAFDGAASLRSSSSAYGNGIYEKAIDFVVGVDDEVDRRLDNADGEYEYDGELGVGAPEAVVEEGSGGYGDFYDVAATEAGPRRLGSTILDREDAMDRRLRAMHVDLGRVPVMEDVGSLGQGTRPKRVLKMGRSLSRSLGNGDCEWVNPVIPSENSTMFGTAIVAYPGSGKRMAFLQMEGMTEVKAGDDYDLSGNHAMKGFVKTSFPHHGE